MTKKYSNSRISMALAAGVAGVAIGFLGRAPMGSPSDAFPQRKNPVYTEGQVQNPFEGSQFYDAVQCVEAERLSHPSAVENRLASKGIANLDVGLEIISQLYRAAPELATQLDQLTERLTDNKQSWRGIGVYGLPSSAFLEGDLDIDTGLKEWYGGQDRRQLWKLDYDIDQAAKNPETLGSGGLENLLKEQSLLKEKIFGIEEPMLTEDDLQKMLNEQIREGNYRDK